MDVIDAKVEADAGADDGTGSEGTSPCIGKVDGGSTCSTVGGISSVTDKTTGESTASGGSSRGISTGNKADGTARGGDSDGA